MKEEKVQLQHPQGKNMPKIDMEKYELIKTEMLEVLKGRELTHTVLLKEVEDHLRGTFEGNVGWYAEGVKLDLEAKKLIKRDSSKPQKYSLV